MLAADLPFLRAAHLRALLAATEADRGAVLVDDGGYPQWLAGCWPERTLSAVPPPGTRVLPARADGPAAPGAGGHRASTGGATALAGLRHRGGPARARDWPQAR